MRQGTVSREHCRTEKQNDIAVRDRSGVSLRVAKSSCFSYYASRADFCAKSTSVEGSV